MIPATLKLALSRTLALITLAIPTVAQEALDLTGSWRFHPGDDVGWSAPEFDDSDWMTIETGKHWEEQGQEELDGYAWYRLRTTIPGSLRQSEAYMISRRLVLSLGEIDDADETWFNGKRIGSTGLDDSEARTAWTDPRIYPLGERDVLWDQENVIAVRVLDRGGMGGMWGATQELRVAKLIDLVEVRDVQTQPADNDRIRVSARVRNRSDQLVRARIQWSALSPGGERVEPVTINFDLEPSANAQYSQFLSPTVPEVYRGQCTLLVGYSRLEFAAEQAAGVRTGEIASELTRAGDFDAFWKRTLNELAAVKPDFQLERKPEHDSATHETYLVTMRSLGDVRVSGWYEKAKATPEKALPALLRVPGYTQAMRPTGIDLPLHVFSFNIRGHGESVEDVAALPRDFWLRGLESPEGYFYRGAFADCVRAMDFLASRTEVNAARIAVTGASQGGGLSFATAALDSRVAFCAPEIPWLCSWERYFKSTENEEVEAWIGAGPERSWDTVFSTLSYFDVLNFADRISCPVLVGLGLEDPVCPPATIYSVLNRLTGDVTTYTYHSEHRLPGEHESRKARWLVDYLTE